MNKPITLEYHHTPSAVGYMVRAFLPKPRLLGTLVTPPIRAIWRGRAPAVMRSGPDEDGGRKAQPGPVHPVHLHAASMRLMMAMLTHPRFPVPIWRVLQVRNQIVQHRPCDPSDRLDVAAALTASRVLGKGAEFDLGVEMSAPDGCVLESVSIFYARGAFGPEGPGASGPSPPEPPTGVRATWSIERRGAWVYARLTGEYNGIHWADPYARALGFASAFAHPHRVLAQVVDRLPRPGPGPALGLEVWFKGPAYYGRPLELAWERDAGDIPFALRLQGDPRPAILGRLSGSLETPAGSPPTGPARQPA